MPSWFGCRYDYIAETVSVAVRREASKQLGIQMDKGYRYPVNPPDATNLCINPNVVPCCSLSYPVAPPPLKVTISGLKGDRG